MDTSDAFLGAICLEPDDDGLRLIYADWLEERGDADRAEFIRVQCELAGMTFRPACDHRYRPPTTPPLPKPKCPGCRYDRRREALRRRELELLRSNATDWLPQECFPGTSFVLDNLTPKATLYWQAPEQLQVDLAFRRGFVESVTLPCAAFAGGPCGRCEGRGDGLTNGTMEATCTDCHGTGTTEGVAGALFRAAPVREVRLSDRRPWVVLPEDGQVCWFLERTGRVDESQSSLPAVLWNLIDARGQHWYDDQVKVFNDEDHHTAADLARTSLSAACVALGRRAAGLPALTPARGAAP